MLRLKHCFPCWFSRQIKQGPGWVKLRRPPSRPDGYAREPPASDAESFVVCPAMKTRFGRDGLPVELLARPGFGS